MPDPDIPSVFIDADVLIAGSCSTTGASHLILQLGELGLLDAVSSKQARTEAERNLRRKLPAALPAFGVLAEAACRWVDDPDPETLSTLQGQADEKDLPILGAALASGCRWLVTFNVRDYRPERQTIRAVIPGDFVQLLRVLIGRLAE